MDIIVKDGIKYFQTDFQGKENEFEKVVFTQYKHLFGDNAILFKKKKIASIFGTETIPDAFVIDFEKEKWFIIEVEISNHDVYSHIALQLMKFSEAHNNPQTRKQLVRFFESEIRTDPFKNALLIANGKTEVFKTVSEIVDCEPELVIIIEQEHEKLKSVFGSFKFKTIINVFKTFTRDGFEHGDAIFQIEPLIKPISRITPLTINIVSQQPTEKIFERKRGRGNRDGLTDYIIPAVKLIKNGTKHSDAFHQIADNLNVAYQTVNAQCTTVLHINTNKFLELVNTGKLADFLKNKFPNKHDIIDREL
ncbi:MAG: hypothetical protein WCM76_14260 [Bacteroidota bacterium]